jgi:hypothetical protein
MKMQITKLERNVDTGVVSRVFWQLKLEKNGYVSTVDGQLGFEERNPSDPDFVPFSNLTEEKVIEWVQPQLNISFYQNRLENDIEEQKEIAKQQDLIVTSDEMPWS